jgi:hypothetical protein
MSIQPQLRLRQTVEVDGDAVCILEQVYLAGVQELGVDMLPSEQHRRTPPGSSLGWVFYTLDYSNHIT